MVATDGDIPFFTFSILIKLFIHIDTIPNVIYILIVFTQL